MMLTLNEWFVYRNLALIYSMECSFSKVVYIESKLIFYDNFFLKIVFVYVMNEK
jgi:hypothetical protein